MSSHHTLNASVPHHLYGHVCREVLYGLDAAKEGEFEPCVVFGITSIPSRAMCFSVLCESGAQWARIPIHMVRWHIPEISHKPHDLRQLQCWDNMGWQFAVTAFDYLREMKCSFRTSDNVMVPARYWFTLDHTDNGFSQYPSQHKCNHLLLLEDGSGQIAAAPNNRIIWDDASFVKPGHRLDYKTMAPICWRAEDGDSNPQDTAMTKDLE